MHVRWYIRMIEVYGHILMNMNNRDIWIWYAIHKWQRQIEVTWFTWSMVLMNRCNMIYMIDKYDMMLYKVTHIWCEFDDT